MVIGGERGGEGTAAGFVTVTGDVIVAGVELAEGKMGGGAAADCSWRNDRGSSSIVNDAAHRGGNGCT